MFDKPTRVKIYDINRILFFEILYDKILKRLIARSVENTTELVYTNSVVFLPDICNEVILILFLC